MDFPDAKSQVMEQVRREGAMTHAQNLITKINEHCQRHCIPKPGAALSAGETSCLTLCMDKYLQVYNTVNRAYMARVQQHVSQDQAGETL